MNTVHHVAHLEFVEPTELVEVFVGTFTYCNSSGEDCDAMFYIKCCEDNGTDEADEQRVEAYNVQLADEWIRLLAEGCSKVAFKETHPNPIF